jgi:hypothetical protein
MTLFLLKVTVPLKRMTGQTQLAEWTDTTQSRQNDAPHINKDSLPLSIFMLFFLKLCNCRWKIQTDITNNTWTLLMKDAPHCLMRHFQEMYLFSSIIVQMGHDRRDRLKDYWTTRERCFVAFYRNTLKQDRFFHTLRFLHFSDNKNEPDKTNENYDRLWKMITIFENLKDAYAKYAQLRI